VNGVALITFNTLGVHTPGAGAAARLIFVMRVMMIIASALSYFVNDAIAKPGFAMPTR